jgi:hypothetical protein
MRNTVRAVDAALEALERAKPGAVSQLAGNVDGRLLAFTVGLSRAHAAAIRRAVQSPADPRCELCGEPAGEGGALCPACAVSR